MMTALKAMMALLLLMSTAGVPSVEETDDGLSTRAARLSAWRRSNSQRSGRAGGDAESGACRPPQAGDAPHAAPVVHAHAHSSVEVTLPPAEVETDDPFNADGLSMQREWTAYSALKLSMSMAVPHPAGALVGLRLKAEPGQTQAVGVITARPSIHVVCIGLVAGSLYRLDVSFYKHGQQVFQESQQLEAPVESAHSSVEVSLPPGTAGMHHVDLALFDVLGSGDAAMLAKLTNVKHAFPEMLLVSDQDRSMRERNAYSALRPSGWLAPRIAVVLRGVAAANYIHYSSRYIKVDWRDTAAGLRKHLVEPLNADVFIHAWRGNEEEFTDVEGQLLAFFSPVGAKVESLRRWDRHFNWLIDDANIDSNFSKNFSSAEWHARGFSTDIVKYARPGRGDRPLCDRSNRGHFCSEEKLNNMFSFYYSWQQSVQLMRNHEEKHNFRYDFVLVARFDLAFKANVEISEALSSSLQLFREVLPRQMPKKYEGGFCAGSPGDGHMKVRELWYDQAMAGSSDAVYKCGQGFKYLTDARRLFTCETLSSHLTVPYTSAAEGIQCSNEEMAGHPDAGQCGRFTEFVKNFPLNPPRRW